MRNIIILASIALLTSCAQSPQPPQQAAMADQPSLSGDESKPQDLSFLDSRIFDSRLSSALKNNSTRPVDVHFVPGVFINKIPERMDRWLSVIAESGGSVVAEPAPGTSVATRGIITDVIDLVIKAYQTVEEQALYDPAKSVQAKLIYDGRSGQVLSVQFSPR